MTDNEGTPRSGRDRDQGDSSGQRSGPDSGDAGRGRERAASRARAGGAASGGREGRSRDRRNRSGSTRPVGGPRSSADQRQTYERGRERPGGTAGRGSEPSGGAERDTAARDPSLPEGIDLADLPRGMKAELKGLPSEMADKVGLRLIAAGTLLEVDPEAAYAQAKVARRLAARLPVVRAVVAETAYAAADYHAALTDYRALRRMTGDNAYLPVMADCERALGRPEEALKLAREAGGIRLDAASAIEMRMVEAGARADLGQKAEALRLLEQEIEASQRAPALNDTSKARLRYAYADHLLTQGQRTKARDWFSAAAKLDRDGMTDAHERVAELDGLVIEFDDTEDPEGVDERSEGRDDVDGR